MIRAAAQKKSLAVGLQFFSANTRQTFKTVNRIQDEIHL